MLTRLCCDPMSIGRRGPLATSTSAARFRLWQRANLSPPGRRLKPWWRISSQPTASLYDQGVVDGFGHISVRHDKDPHRYLLSRSLAPALVTADDILEYDLDSNPVDPDGRFSYLERFIHGELYKARADIIAVVHSHSPAVIPFADTAVALRPMNHIAGFPGAEVFRAIYTEVNARMQDEAMKLGVPKFLSREEAAAATITNDGVVDRPWALWKQRAVGKS